MKGSLGSVGGPGSRGEGLGKGCVTGRPSTLLMTLIASVTFAPPGPPGPGNTKDVPAQAQVTTLHTSPTSHELPWAGGVLRPRMTTPFQHQTHEIEPQVHPESPQGVPSPTGIPPTCPPPHGVVFP